MPNDFELIVIGGGVNGCGIARDAAGRGLELAVIEQGDLASGTSSASTKLFHGGLRYLEYFEFRLVREALRERETLLRAMPHIAWPMRFVLPYHKAQRFDVTTPAARWLGRAMPWLRGRRPAWVIRLGLALYDSLAGRQFLPGTTRLDLSTAPEGGPLQDRYTKAFEYSDGWVDDARLVALNARDAAARGAAILTRHKLTAATHGPQGWTVTLDTETGSKTLTAKALVNAAGPWVAQVLSGPLASDTPGHIRLVRGSHILTRRLWDHDKAYFLQGTDGRICFAIPYEQDFTLIGTTDADHTDPDTPATCTEAERDYMLNFVNGYFKTQLTPADILHSYAGLRPLRDAGTGAAASATRDYELVLSDPETAPALHVFGGKITTYRKLAESAVDKLAAVFPALPEAWTAGVPLPGGDFEIGGAGALAEGLIADYPFLTPRWAQRLIRAYGTEARMILGDAQTAADLGEEFGATLTEAELRWMVTREYARTAEDALWRRSKLGLHMTEAERDAVAEWFAKSAPVEASQAA